MEGFEVLNIQTNLFECIPAKEENDNILVSDINLAGALPYTYHNGAGEEVEVKVQSFVKKNGEFLETRIKGKQVGSIQSDVLMMWQTMFWEQMDSQNNLTQDGKILIHYNISYLTERMGLQEGSRRMVSEAISNLLELKYEITNFGYVEYKESGEKHIGFKKQRMGLVTRHGEIKGMSSIDGQISSRGSFFVELDATILANISAGMVAKVDSSQYLALKSGPQRRLLPQLEAKRKLLGPKFTVKLTEIAGVLGFNNPGKQQERVSNTFKKLQETLGNIDYHIIKRPGIHEWDIYVEFKDGMIEDKSRSEVEVFYDLLVEDFGEQALEEVDFRLRDVQIIKGQIENNVSAEDPVFDFHGEKCPLYQFLIDLALFQIIRERYVLTSRFSKFVLFLLGASKNNKLAIPSGYRQFVELRISEEKTIRVKKEVELARKKEEEELVRVRKFKLEAWEKNYEMVLKNPEVRARLNDKAIEAWLALGNAAEDLEGIMGKLNREHINRLMKEIATEEFLAGTLMDNIVIN